MMRQFRTVRAGLWALASLLFLSMQVALPGRADAAPTVTSVSPAAGYVTGGDTVTITGTDFTSVQAVIFGGTASANFTVDSPTQITATTPAHAAGAANVLVRTAGGDSNVNIQFTYRALVNITPLYNFLGGANDGAGPVGAVVFDKEGNLYGVTRQGGGRWGLGTVFMLHAPALTTRTILHIFVGGRDGATPDQGLVIDDSGVLYGVTTKGGRADLGVVFRLMPPADAAQKPDANAWRYDLLYTFKNQEDGATPSGLVLDRLGNIYGTTVYGSNYNDGTLFKLTASQTVPWRKTRLHVFNPGVGGGRNPEGPLLIDKNGYVVGTTRGGGPRDAGTVYSFALPFGPATVTPTLRYAFGGRGGDGAYPRNGLIASRNNTFYGTTERGGRGYTGTVFQLKLVGGRWQESVIAKNFTQYGNGIYPKGVVSGPGGALYGVTTEGAASLFKLSPPSGGQTDWSYLTLHRFDGPNPIVMRGRVIYGTTRTGGAGYGMVYRAQEQ
jgi:hypothetical protein